VRNSQSEGVTLWTGVNFTSNRRDFTEGHSDFTLLDFNDQTASLRINGPYEVRLFEHINFGGKQAVFTANASDLDSSSIGRYNASSLRLKRLDLTGGVFLYSEKGYQGKWSVFTDDVPNLTDEAVGNDTASSLMIRGDYQVCLWEHANYQGRSWLFTTDAPSLGNAVGRVSSIQVNGCAGGTP